MNVNLDLIIDVCENYSGKNIYSVYILNNIPEKKLQNAVKNFPLTNAKRVIMLYDSTVFGSCKTGIAVCDNGVFYKNDWMTEPRYKYFTWEEFSNVEIYSRKDNIFFGNKYNTLVPILKDRKSIEELLKKIQQTLHYEYEQDKNTEVNTFLDENLKITTTDKVWMFAIDQKQYGPMGTCEIEKMVTNNLFNPEITFVWKQGMDNWELFNNIPELRAIVEKLNKNIIQPPPMPQVPPIPSMPNVDNTKISLVSDKIDINNCKLEELLTIDCIDLQRANSLIKIRQKGKKFCTVEDITNVLDLKPHEVEELKNKIIFNLPKTLNGVRRIEF